MVEMMVAMRVGEKELWRDLKMASHLVIKWAKQLALQKDIDWVG